MSNRLIVSDEVRDLLGTELVDALTHNDPEYRCPVCRVDGNFQHEDTSVLVQRHPDATRLLMGHATCIGSVVTDSDDPAPEPSTRDEDDDVIAMVSLISDSGKTRPYLFVHTRMPYSYMTEHGDSISPQQAGLLRHGWEPVTGYPGKYSRARGWRLELDDRGRGRVVSDTGDVLLDRLPEETPDAWFNLARRSGLIAVLFGELGLTEARTGEDASQLITQACRRGRAIGARVKVTVVDRVPGPGGPSGMSDRTEEEIRKEVAGTLEAAMRTRADPDGHDHLNRAEPVVPLPTRPLLHPFLMEQATRPWPALLVDLNDPDEQRAAQTLQAFVDAGLNRDRRLGDNMFPLPPAGWSHITWPSQILILAGRDTQGSPRKVLFEPAAFPHPWLTGLDPSGAIAFIVTNLRGRTISADLLEEISAQGGLAVCSLAGMLATDPG